MQITAELEEWSGSPTIRFVKQNYHRIPMQEFRDAPARLQPRQVVFYRNLMSLALALGSNVIPVDFEDAQNQRRYLDRGCMKIAEHALFIEPLQNDDCGVVSQIVLRWNV